MHGLLILDKPSGITSRDAVDRVLTWFPKKTRIGHAGTLDPLATGVLVVCIGLATRLVAFVQDMGKTYLTRFRMGATSDTDDADGTLTSVTGAMVPTREQVEEALAKFIGAIEQIPPAYSAVKLDGRRAHTLARKGKPALAAARTVQVDAIRLLNYDYPALDLEIDCGKGTYIRSIARDLGTMLNCGGIVETLRRMRVGPFRAEDGIDLDIDPELGRSKILPVSAATAELPRVWLSADSAHRFKCGQRVPPLRQEQNAIAESAVLDQAGNLLGIGRIVPPGLVKPVIVVKG